MNDFVYPGWDRAESDTGKQGQDYVWEIYLSSSPANRLYFGNNSKHHKIICIEFPGNTLNSYNPPALHGMKIFVGGLAYIDKSKDYLIIRNDMGDDDIFMAFSASLAAGIKKSADYHETIAIFENTIDKYRKYFAGFSSSLSEAEEQGLCGELLFLRKLISEYGSKAVKWWLGPDKNKRDFVLEDFSAEVKTTLGQKETVITVANENQLDNSGTARLILVVYVLEKNACGNVCVSGLIREISGMLTDVGDYQLFFRKLENAGIKQGVYTDKNIYTVQNSVKYLVNNNFPCIRKKDLSDQIFDVKYRLNLSTLSGFIIKD